MHVEGFSYFLLAFFTQNRYYEYQRECVTVKEQIGGTRMLNFEEELEKFQPSMDIEKVEDVVYHNNLADVTDIVKELIQDAKGTL